MSRQQQNPASESSEITGLVHRNIELEAEIRHINEQLAEAQNTIRCLATTFSNQQAQDVGAQISDLAAQLERVQIENIHLKQQIGLTQGFGPELDFDVPSHAGGLGVTQSATAGQSPGDYTSASGSGQIPEDLLTFSDRDDSHSTALSTYKSGAGASEQISLLDKAISPQLMPTTPSNGKQATFGSATTALPIRSGASNVHAAEGFLVDLTNDDGVKPIWENAPLIPAEPTEEAEEPLVEHWPATHSPAPLEPELIFSCPFWFNEHNRLAGSAVFIEEIPEEGLDEHWKEYAAQQRNTRHSSEEWKKYYEAVVRPEYLAKRGKAEGDGGENLEQDEESEGSVKEVEGTGAWRSATMAKENDMGRRFRYQAILVTAEQRANYSCPKVLIENVPVGAPISAIVPQAISGRIVSVVFFKTSEMKLKQPEDPLEPRVSLETDAVIITFLSAADAEVYAKFANMKVLGV